MGLVLIGGSFLMGDESNGPVQSEPRQAVLPGQVRGDAGAVAGGDGQQPQYIQGGAEPGGKRELNDCQAFFAKLNAKRASEDGKFSLPTEAQWEYACRAGSTTKYCFGDGDSPTKGVCLARETQGKAHPVGQKKPNSWGLHDMHGNVWEWCADWSSGDYYGSHLLTTQRGLPRACCVNRGGCFARAADFCRSAAAATSASSATSTWDSARPGLAGRSLAPCSWRNLISSCACCG